MKKEYIAPTLTVVTFKIERGFALSNALGPQNSFLGLLGLEADLEDYNAQGQQKWYESETNYFGTGW